MNWKWTPGEDEQLSTLLSEGKSALEVSSLHNRTMAAVRARARQLGLAVERSPTARKQQGAAASHEIVDGRMMPKSAQ
jgi:hypothetical protein